MTTDCQRVIACLLVRLSENHCQLDGPPRDKLSSTWSGLENRKLVIARIYTYTDGLASVTQEMHSMRLVKPDGLDQLT
jgi:hypothetical protein